MLEYGQEHMHYSVWTRIFRSRNMEQRIHTETYRYYKYQDWISLRQRKLCVQVSDKSHVPSAEVSNRLTASWLEQSVRCLAECYRVRTYAQQAELLLITHIIGWTSQHTVLSVGITTALY